VILSLEHTFECLEVIMGTLDLTDVATLWFEEAKSASASGPTTAPAPVRMLWRGERWRVTDPPTEPEGLYWTTHPPEFAAWRFQATDPRGRSRVFDLVQHHGDHHWMVVHVYD
jgi:hypothetical protein